MSLKVVFENSGLSEHLATHVTEKSGAVTGSVGRAAQEVLVHGHRVGEDL